MMEEVSDDTNGESSFEFVGGKNDENILKEASLSDAIEKVNITSTSTTLTDTVPIAAAAFPPQSTTNVESNVTFYNPADAPSFFTPMPQDPMFQPSVPIPEVSAAETTQPLYSLPSSASPVSQPAVGISNPGTAQYSVSMPVEDVPPPNPTLLEASESGSGVWGWIKGNQLLNKVAERAKNSVDSVITTLDPGMKEIINTGGDISVIVASEDEIVVSAVREAFQLVFGKATVQGIAVESGCIAPQPVGFSAGLNAAKTRISSLWQQGHLDGNQIVLAVENFITELTPENWFDMDYLLLQDSNSNQTLEVYTQAVPVSSMYVAQAKEQTQADYSLSWSGHAISIGQIIASALGVQPSEWHQALTGVSRRETLFLAAKTIAGLYKSQLRR